MNYVIYFLTLIDQTIIGVFLYSQLLPLKTRFALPCVTWFGLYSLSFTLFHFLGDYAPPSAVQMILCMLYQTAVMLFFEGNAFMRFCTAAVFIILCGAAELMTVGILCLIFRMPVTEFYIFQNENHIVAVGRIYAVDVILFMTFVFFLLLRYRRIREEYYVRDILIVLSFDCVHMIYLYLYYTDPDNSLSEVNNIIQFGMQTMLIFMLFHQFYSGREVRRLEQAKQSLELMQKNREREVDYYKAAEEKYTEISMIRHDLVNHLTAVEALARQPDGKADARELLEEIKRRTHAISVPNTDDINSAGGQYAKDTDI
ncbi:MAG: hypothetical protein Q4A05_09245 [Ruminococcus sp.]|nr:hypothetical protein [Ruminococcus sp.]